MELLAFGKTGWGDELFYATLMTIAVSVTAMLIGFLFSLILLHLNYQIINFKFYWKFYTTVIQRCSRIISNLPFLFWGKWCNNVCGFNFWIF